MADVPSVGEVLQKVLENLNAEDLQVLQKRLVPGVKPEVGVVVGSTVQVTVREVVQAYGEKDAVEVLEKNLKTMNHSYLAQSLSGIKGSLHPEVPYEQVLYEGLQNTTIITVHGQAKDDDEKFHINLYKGSDIAFHFNPRFNQDGKQVLVRNSLIRDVWGPEETDLSSPFPFTPGNAFEVKILCTDADYRVKVDKKPLLNFTHRIKEMNQIRKLSVNGVLLDRVTISPLPLWITTPSTYVLNDVISGKKTITIPLHVKPNAKKFTIDVMKDEDILFHFKPYFSDGGKERVIVRNSLIGGVWGSEERETPSFSFEHGKSYLVKILCTDKEFKVYSGNAHLLNFTYRGFDITTINKITVLHDVITWDIRVE
ncbi:galectin-9-like [Astyanax mexicanus]|uniref:Galectin n=1 Tax=Astyanax mexicanus TaxID=7994 RepID=A0A8T2KQK6_ASTMX|nr:galectin-9-like [Astyanax mexicanus]